LSEQLDVGSWTLDVELVGLWSVGLLYFGGWRAVRSGEGFLLRAAAGDRRMDHKANRELA
jgi:hypothetical protein